jgi:hypothetical protein
MSKTVRLFELNIWVNLHDFALGNIFLFMTAKAQWAMNKWTVLHQNSKCLCSKGNNWENEKIINRIGQNVYKSSIW